MIFKNIVLFILFFFFSATFSFAQFVRNNIIIKKVCREINITGDKNPLISIFPTRAQYLDEVLNADSKGILSSRIFEINEDISKRMELNMGDFRVFKYPSLNFRRLSLETIMHQIEHEPKVFLKNFSKPNDNLTFSQSVDNPAYPNLSTKERLEEKNVYINPMILTSAICAKFGVYSLFCPHALTRVNEITAHKMSDIIGLSLIKDYFDKPHLYRLGASRAAVRIINRIKKNDLQRTSNIYDDVVKAFLSTGLSKETATERAWTLLTAYAVKGPEVNWYAAHLKPAPDLISNYASIYIIALGIQVLDSMGQAKGYTYSLPSQFENTCDIAKPYHFWMSATIARQLRKEGYSQDNSYTGAYLAEFGYQMFGFNRNGTKYASSFKAQDSNKARLDLHFAAMGAVFGANETAVKKINSDKILAKTLSESTYQELNVNYSKTPKNDQSYVISNYMAFSVFEQKTKAIRLFDLHRKNLQIQ